jgi:POT family proton-dependent oligopeptide transporter
VYTAPFFGGMLADRLLGARRAVILGGCLMAAGELMLTLPNTTAFFTGLALLIAGNGFFKPNISTIVGSLYPPGSIKRDGAFTIFYMGVNLGAAISPLLCGYIGENYGYQYGFGLATIGMLTGIVVFVAPTRVAQVLIAVGAAIGACGLLYFRPDNPFSIGMNVLVAVALLAAAAIAWTALARGGLPHGAGAPRDRQRLSKPLLGPLSAEWTVYLGTLAVVAAFVLLVSGFAPLTADNRPVTLVPDSMLEEMKSSDSPMMGVLVVVLKEVSRPVGLVLMLTGLAACVYLGIESLRLDKIGRQRMYVVGILTFFSLLFWAFFEQAGSSVNNFTDRNIDRVSAQSRITADDIGKTIHIQPTQAQFGYHNGDELFRMHTLTKLRKEHANDENFEIEWKVAADNVGMGVSDRVHEIPASTFQSVNAVFILALGLVFTAMWSVLAARGWEPSTPVKFATGLLLLGLGFVAFWHGAQTHDDRGIVAMSWLLLGYLLHTMGELCLSPVGLSMVTKLSPARLVSTVMGAWFLATGFSQFLAGIIAQFTGVTHEEGTETVIPVPLDTVHVYGDVFGTIAIAAVVAAAICYALSPLLTRWMHTGEAPPAEH